MAKKTVQARLVLIILIAILASVVFLAKKFSSRPVEKIPLPINEQIGGYIQSLLVDLDKDEIKEAVAIYYDRGDGKNIRNTFFVIFKLKNNQWTKLTETKLGYITFMEGKEFPSGVDKALNKFSLLDLTNDGYPDVLVESKIEGSGGYLTAYIYGLRNGKLEQLWAVESMTKSKVGIDGDKVWLIIPNYGPGDRTCCPFEWVKSWWQWQQDNFKTIAELREPDLQELQATVFRDEFRK